MKVSSTIFGILCSSAVLFAQGRQRTPETETVFDSEPVAVRDVRSDNVSEAVLIINTIRTGVITATKETAPKRVFTEADYQTLTLKADEFVLQRKYDDAILLYREILKEREDPYAKDRILEAEALRAKQQKEDEQRKKDDILRAKAEFESSKKYESLIVHLTGALISDESSSLKWTSKAFNKNDRHSSFLQAGKHNNLAHVLRTAASFTLDGIAIPANTRLIVYKEQNCTGEVLLDVTGPAIINNMIYADSQKFNTVNTKEFNQELQPYFPQATRSWSTTNMREWVNGSMEVKVGFTE
ncbi:hypothetical protein D3C87_196620 [compost metagenome]